MLTHLTKKPGEFKALCKLGAWRDVAAVLAMAPPLEGAYPERWSHTLERSEMLVPCDFETTDRAAFDTHMAELHDRKPGWKPPLDRGWENGRTPVIRPRSPKPSSGGAGRPFKASAKATAADVHSCPTCSLIAEVRDRAGELWWDEHLRGCALAQAGEAS